MKDLFGNELTEEEARRKLKARTTPANGYAWRPGTGPEGETCGSCRHIVSNVFRSGRSVFKCKLNEKNWTHGRGSDVLAKAPACKKWEADDAGT